MTNKRSASPQTASAWILPGEDIRLGRNEIHVWRIPLDLPEESARQLCGFLSQSEIERADRFHFKKDRLLFIAARAAMRQILERYLNIAPRSLIFVEGAKGKPELPYAIDSRNVKFNLSHSCELALLAIAENLCVGIDLEFVDHTFASEEIASRFFAPDEVSTLLALAPDRRAEAFFDCWTRKEAYIKALGEGLSVPLESFSVAFGIGASAALLRVDASLDDASRWRMYDITVHPEYKAALVVEGKEHQLRQWQWIWTPQILLGESVR